MGSLDWARGGSVDVGGHRCTVAQVHPVPLVCVPGLRGPRYCRVVCESCGVVLHAATTEPVSVLVAHMDKDG